MREFGYDVGSANSGDKVDVAVGFQTDFASIPRLFWSIFPKWGKYGNAAVIHDWLYWTQERPRKLADDILIEAMGVLGVGAITRYMIYLSVRVFGWFAWVRNQADRSAGFDRILAALPQKANEESKRPGALMQLGRQVLRKMNPNKERPKPD
jgi:hypothetical protein